MTAFNLNSVPVKKLSAVIIGTFLLQSSFAQLADSVFTAGLPGSNMLKLQKDGGFVVRGEHEPLSVTNVPPQEGAGTRLMWYPKKASLRAGVVLGTFWDEANIGHGSVAIGYNNRASADYATAFGINCTAAQTSSFAVGEQNVASGASSVALGYHSHTNARQGSFVFGDRSTVDTIRAGVNHSATWRVSGGFRLFTSANLSTGLTIQSGASVSNWGQSNAVVSTSTGAYLSTAGVWTNTSDINRKHLFEKVNTAEILQKIGTLPITEWSYKAENNTVRHIGPMAQDFAAAFGLGSDERTIGTVDADGIALACIQALYKRTEDQAKAMEAMSTSQEALLKRIEKLEQEKKEGPIGKLSMMSLALIPFAGVGMWMYRRRKDETQA